MTKNEAIRTAVATIQTGLNDLQKALAPIDEILEHAAALSQSLGGPGIKGNGARGAGPRRSNAASLRKPSKTKVKAKSAKSNGASANVGRGGRGRSAALDNKVLELVKASSGGLGSVDISKQLSIPLKRAKSIAQKLKGKGTFKVVGLKRSAKYQFAG